MVNIGLKVARRSRIAPLWDAENAGKPEIFGVNKSFSKRLKFAENSQRIRLECGPKPELPLQPCLLACISGEIRTAARRSPRIGPVRKRQGYGLASCFFCSGLHSG